MHGNDSDNIEEGLNEFQAFIDKLSNILKKLMLDINIEKTG